MGVAWRGALRRVRLRRWDVVRFVMALRLADLIVSGRGVTRKPWVLLAEAVLLAAACAGLRIQQSNVAVAAIVARWGWRTRGSRSMAAPDWLTYVTGAYVTVGQLLAAALTRRALAAPNLVLWAAWSRVRCAGAGLSLDQSRRVWLPPRADWRSSAIVAVTVAFDSAR